MTGVQTCALPISHKLSYVEVAEIVGLTLEEVKALDTDEAVIEIKGF